LGAVAEARSGERVARFADAPTGCLDGRGSGWEENPRLAGVTSGASEVEVVGLGLVEVEVWDGLGLGGVERGCLIEEPREEIALRRSARGREGRGFVGEVEVEEDGGDDGRVGQNARILMSAPQAGQSSGSTS
jgi:hypothetical protein